MIRDSLEPLFGIAKLIDVSVPKYQAQSKENAVGNDELVKLNNEVKKLKVWYQYMFLF